MTEHVKKISEHQFEETIKKGVTLVDFYADWCGPCRMMTPHLETAAHALHGQVVIVKVDVDKAQQVASTYQVTSIPTLILFKDGKEVNRVVGLCDAKAIQALILSAEK